MKKDIPSLILWEDLDYLVINKPPLITVLDDFGSSDNILKWFKNQFPEIHACHRLDKETSGALILAKSLKAYTHMSIQFERRSIKKVYHALIQSRQNFKEQKVNIRLQTSARGHTKANSQGKESITIFNTIEKYLNHSLVECIPVTGRTHQIRAHLSLLQTPIVADDKYGGPKLFLSSIKKAFNLKKGTEEKPLISRVALHAHSIEFETLNKKIVRVEAPYPKDLSATLNQLKKQLIV